MRFKFQGYLSFQKKKKENKQKPGFHVSTAQFHGNLLRGNSIPAKKNGENRMWTNEQIRWICYYTMYSMLLPAETLLSRSRQISFSLPVQVYFRLFFVVLAYLSLLVIFFTFICHNFCSTFLRFISEKYSARIPLRTEMYQICFPFFEHFLSICSYHIC